MHEGTCEIVAFFGDGEKTFALTPDTILELERKLGSGIGAIARRFFSSDFGFADLTEVLRLGLIGGGMDPEDAHALVSTYAARMSVTALYTAALPVVEAAMFGGTKKPRIRKAKAPVSANGDMQAMSIDGNAA